MRAASCSSVDGGALLNGDGAGLHVAGEQEYRQPRAKAQIDDRDGPGGIEAQDIGHLGEGEHHHLKGHHHAEDAQQIDAVGDPVSDAADVPGAHGGAQQNQRHGQDRNDKAPQHGGPEVRQADAVSVVVQPDKHVSGGQGKGRAADIGLAFEAVEEHHDQREYIGQRDERKNGGEGCVGGTPPFLCCRHAIAAPPSCGSAGAGEARSSPRSGRTPPPWPVPRPPSRRGRRRCRRCSAPEAANGWRACRP